MADRVAVFNEGRIVQVGPPEEMYERPATRFVAHFVGSANVLGAAQAAALGGAERPSSLRPEKILLLPPGAGAPQAAVLVDGVVEDVSYQGPVRRVVVRSSAGLKLVAAVPASASSVAQGDAVRLAIPRAALQPMESEG